MINALDRMKKLRDGGMDPNEAASQAYREETNGELGEGGVVIHIALVFPKVKAKLDEDEAAAVGEGRTPLKGLLKRARPTVGRVLDTDPGTWDDATKAEAEETVQDVYRARPGWKGDVEASLADVEAEDSTSSEVVSVTATMIRDAAKALHISDDDLGAACLKACGVERPEAMTPDQLRTVARDVIAPRLG